MMIGSKVVCPIVVAAAVLEATLVQGVGAFGFSARGRGESITSTSRQNLVRRSDVKDDLTAFVRPSTIDQSEIYTEALSLLTSIQSAPSCNRLAASTLLAGCQSIDGSTPNTEAAIEQARSIYAAQLAMCEIVSAGSAIPQQCRSLEPPKAKPGLGGSRGPGRTVSDEKTSGEIEVASRQLGQCLQALESRPQWWTSYSNSRQNAVVMCKAAREDIAKDDLIKLHQSMVHTNTQAHSALSKAVQQAHEGLTEQLKFAAAIETFQQRLLRDLESSSVESRSYFERVVKSMESVTFDVVNRLTNAVKSAEDGIADLEENIHKSSEEVVDLKKNVGRVFQQAVSGSAELAASQTKQWQTSQDLATKLEVSLGSLRDTEIRDLLGAFGNMHSELRMSNELVSRMYQRQNSLDERLAYHDQLLASLNSNAEAIYAAQTQQGDTQARLFDQMQMEIHVARGLLADVTASAESLQASVENTASKIATMATFSGASGSILRWGWLSLVIFVVYQFNPRLAAFAMAGLGLLFLLWASGMPSPFASIPSDTVLVHYASGYQIPLFPVLKVAALLIMVVIAGTAYRLSAGFPEIYDRALSVASRLAFTHRQKESECYL